MRAKKKTHTIRTCNPPDISFVVNAHCEGLMLQLALRSAFNARQECDARGIKVEMIVVGDKTDDATKSIIERHRNIIDTIDFVNFGNLGLSRQHAISLSTGNFICFLDGDDIWQRTWPARAFEFAGNGDASNCVFHTEIFAGYGTSLFLRHQIQTSDCIFHPMHMIATWHFCNNLFAHRSIFERFPIQPYDHSEGYGSEDWHWSCETVAAGISRIHVPETIYFYRQDPAKPSLGKLQGLALRPTILFQNKNNFDTYSNFSGIADQAKDKELKVTDQMCYKKEAPAWVFSEVKIAAALDFDIHQLVKKLPDLKIATPALHLSLAYVISRCGSFCRGEPYGLVGIDCDSLGEYSPDCLAMINHGLRSYARGNRLVVLCGDLLARHQLVVSTDNILYVNHKMLLRIEAQDSYALNNGLINFISSNPPSFVLSCNSGFVDHLTGLYGGFFVKRNITTRRMLFQSVHDIGISFNSRRILENFQQCLFNYREIWVTDAQSADYLRAVYSARNVNICATHGHSMDLAVICALEGRTDGERIHSKTKYTRERQFLHPASDAIDVSCVLNLHREGDLAVSTFQSISRLLLHAHERGIVTELIIVLDNSDEATEGVIERVATCGLIPKGTSVLNVNHKCLARSRRSGIEAARGEYVALLDGDDLYSANWVTEAFWKMKSSQGNVVCHPYINVFFGLDCRAWWHPDMEQHKIPYPALLLDNFWSSLSFSKRSLYIEFPFADIDLASGLGFEDWHWNMETLAHEVVHVVVPETAHFIRLKPNGSLNQATAKQKAIVRGSRFPAEVLFERFDARRNDRSFFQFESQ